MEAVPPLFHSNISVATSHITATYSNRMHSFSFSHFQLSAAAYEAPPADAGTPVPPSESTRGALAKAIADLRDVPHVHSSDDAKRVEAILLSLILNGSMPGYTTPEHLVGLDCQAIDWSSLAYAEYAGLLTQLSRLFTETWPEPNQDVKVFNMFKMDYSTDYTHVAFDTLQQQLQRLPKRASSLLAALLQDEQVVAISLLHILRQRGGLMQRFARTIKVLPERQVEEHDAKTNLYFQLLIGLPNLVANKLGRQLPEIFSPVSYGRLLLSQWIKALHFVLQCGSSTNYFDLTPLSSLLSRVLNHFYDAATLKSLLRVLEDYAQAPKPRMVVQQILRELEPSACFKVAQGALNNDLDLYMLLGPAALDTPHWQHCLLQKLPHQRTPTANAALLQLVNYLQKVAPSRLQLLFVQLLGIWSKRLSLQKLSSQEHLGVCKLLLLSGKLNDNLKSEHKKQLHDGLAHHLQSPDSVQRYLGMKTVELLYNSSEKANVKEEDRLRFNYDALKETPHWQILEELDELANHKFPSKNDRSVRVGPELLERLEKHMAEFIEGDEQIPKRKLDEKTSKIVNMQLDSDLDSDDEEEPKNEDDLKPFDMSNDISTSQEQRPKFLLDLLHLLRTKVSNYQIFEAALNTAEQLIRSQLAHHDVKLAIDLLQLFLTLEMQYYYENFNRTQFQCCVAICVSHPGECVQMLCQEFHTDNTRYAANVRILILQVIAATAKELAGNAQTQDQIDDLVPPASKQPRKFQLNLEEDEAARRLAAAQRIIRERLRSKTRRFLSKPKITSEISAKTNPFHAVAGTFFFGLVRGSRTRQMLYVKYDSIVHDIDTQLLVNMLHTLAVLVMCSQNCPLLPAMTREIFDLCTFVRFNAEARVRAGTLQLLGVALVTTPAHLLVAHFAESLNELQRWLEEFVRSPLVGGESSDECRELAEQILSTCYKLFDTAMQEQARNLN